MLGQGTFAKVYHARNMKTLESVAIKVIDKEKVMKVGLIDQIKREHISAVFVENITDPRLIKQIASETGAKVGGELFSDALSKPGGEAATYTDMFGHNRAALIEAMTGQGSK